MLQRKLFWCGAFAALCCAVNVGCGGGEDEGVDVGGKLVEGGQPPSIKDYQEGYNYYEVFFAPPDGGKQYSENVAEDGSFELQRIPPGTYTVGVCKMVSGEQGNVDEWGGKYEPANSSVTVEIQSDKGITIDLDEIRGGAKPPRAEDDS